MSPPWTPPEDRSCLVTGLGVVSSIGVGREAFWEAVLEGRQGARPVRAFDTGALRNRVGCEVNDSLLPALPEPLVGLPRASRLGAVAAAEALADAGVEPEGIDAVCVGTTIGDLPDVESCLRPGGAAPERLREVALGNFGGRVAGAVGIEAPAFTIATSCSAGNISLSRGADLIRSGQAVRVLVGGAEAFSKLAFVGFSRMRGMAPERCAPFSADRQGMLLGEGAGFLVLEAAAAAAARGARPYARVAGYGLSCDAYHIVAPDPTGAGAAAAMRAALEDAGMEASEVDYVSAHGTGTMQNDLAESFACRAVFTRHDPWVSSLKALVGHCLGAAGAVEAVACVLALRHQRLIPAWNVETQDPQCEVRLPRNGDGSTGSRLSVVLNNAFAFGGNNSCVVLQRCA